MEYEIWAEGYLDQGMEDIPEKAKLMGKQEANTFVEACEIWFRNNVSKESFERYFYIRNGKPYFWVELFDNEADARKSFE